VKQLFKRWWGGVYVSFENDPNSQFIIVSGTQRRHWTSTVAHAVVDFLAKEWKWVIGVSIPITGLIMTYVRFF